jgi:hypothetical protein
MKFPIQQRIRPNKPHWNKCVGPPQTHLRRIYSINTEKLRNPTRIKMKPWITAILLLGLAFLLHFIERYETFIFPTTDPNLKPSLTFTAATTSNLNLSFMPNPTPTPPPLSQPSLTTHPHNPSSFFQDIISAQLLTFSLDQKHSTLLSVWLLILFRETARALLKECFKNYLRSRLKNEAVHFLLAKALEYAIVVGSIAGKLTISNFIGESTLQFLSSVAGQGLEKEVSRDILKDFFKAQIRPLVASLRQSRLV